MKLPKQRFVATNSLAVLIAAPDEDVHAQHVIACLSKRGISAACMSAQQFVEVRSEWSPSGPLTVEIAGRPWRISESTTVWWRRPGVAEQRTGSELEDRLVAEEVAALLPGVLAAVGVRWVDAPWVLSRARLKPLQLAVAQTTGASIPATMVTGSPAAASLFASCGRVLAKAASTGVGIAPHVAVVPEAELGRVAACPTTLQRPVEAVADVRVVTIGKTAYRWIRQRNGSEPVDWRAADPRGSAFAFSERPVSNSPVEIAQRLGLTFSVQDWLQTDSHDVFLEVNPQGQCLFLDRADEILVPALADLLALKP